MNAYFSSLSIKAKALLLAAITAAAAMQVDPVKNWVTANLGQHPKLTSLATTLIFIIGLLHNPLVLNTVQGALKYTPTSPTTGNVEVVPNGGTNISTKIPMWILFAFATVLMTGCATATAPVTPAPPQLIYQRGATAMDDFATDLVSAQNIVISLHKGAAIDDATFMAIQAKFKLISQYGVQVDALIAGQASASTITARLNAAIDSLTAISTAAAKLDLATLQQVNAGVAALKLLLTNVLPIFSGVSSVHLTTGTLEAVYGSIDDGNSRRTGRRTGAADLQSSEGFEGRARWNGAVTSDHGYLGRRGCEVFAG